MAEQDLKKLDSLFDTYITLTKVNKIVALIDANPYLVSDTRKLIFHNNAQKSMRASWLLLHMSYTYPKLILKELKYIIKFLHQSNIHTGAIRNCVAIFKELNTPEKFCAEMFDFCLSYAKNSTMPLGVRSYAIVVLNDICKKYPELIQEFELVLNELESFPQAPSLRFNIKKSRIALKKITQR